jgi:Arc/MetJ-type ribon-helix-helix transcriptional regulator
MSALPIFSGADAEGLDAQARSLLEALENLPNFDQLRDLGRTSPVIQAHLTRLAASLVGSAEEPEPRLRLVGRARKVSVSLPEDLTAAVQQRVGRGEFSQYVTEAVTRQLELDLLGDLSALLQAEHGPVSEEALAEARHSWPDTQ